MAQGWKKLFWSDDIYWHSVNPFIMSLWHTVFSFPISCNQHLCCSLCLFVSLSICHRCGHKIFWLVAVSQLEGRNKAHCSLCVSECVCVDITGQKDKKRVRRWDPNPNPTNCLSSKQIHIINSDVLKGHTDMHTNNYAHIDTPVAKLSQNSDWSPYSCEGGINEVVE